MIEAEPPHLNQEQEEVAILRTFARSLVSAYHTFGGWRSFESRKLAKIAVH